LSGIDSAIVVRMCVCPVCACCRDVRFGYGFVCVCTCVCVCVYTREQTPVVNRNASGCVCVDKKHDGRAWRDSLQQASVFQRLDREMLHPCVVQCVRDCQVVCDGLIRGMRSVWRGTVRKRHDVRRAWGRIRGKFTCVPTTLLDDDEELRSCHRKFLVRMYVRS
jgi:hypothetical protein